MGWAKNHEIECEERGYYDCDKVVCRDCIGNKVMKDCITKNGYMGTCDYCGKRRKVIDLESILSIIVSGMRFQYENAENYYFDGEYVSTVYSTYEIIHYELYDDLKIENEELLDDICEALPPYDWCEADPYSEKSYETELYSWHSFCNLVKYKMRYVFYESKNVFKEYDLSNPVNILETISGYAEQLGLIRTLSVNTKLYRGRLHGSARELCDIAEFGPPPLKYAKGNRMSAEGISMFYAAFDEKTVLNEINSSGDNFATIASFKVRRLLTVLDLSKLRKMRIPSIFDKKERHKRAPITFLKAFANEISQRIDDLPNIEYVPTQIVTEYFRYVFKSEDCDRIDGIIYNSSQNEAGYCIVLFMDQQEFLDDDKCMLDKASVRLKYYQKNFVPIELDVK